MNPKLRVLLLAVLLAAAVVAAIAYRAREDEFAAVVAVKEAAARSGRSVDPALLQFAMPPERDEFGYPADDIDKREFVALLEAKRYAELEQRLQALWQATQQDIRNEYRLLDAYYAFWRDDVAFRPLVEAWIRARPGSPESNFSAALHYLKRAQEARGTKWASDTSAEQFAAVDENNARATRYLRKALDREPTHLIGYRASFQLLRHGGWGKPQRELLAQALVAHPTSFLLRADALGDMTPRWGGSYEEMQSVAGAAQKHVAANPRLRALLGFVLAEQAFTLQHDGDLDGALKLYDQALEFGADSTLLRERAQTWMYMGDPLRAAQDAQRALRQRPQGLKGLELKAESLYWLALMAPAAQRESVLHAAFDHYDLLRTLEPGNAEWQGWLDHILYARKHCQQNPLACGCRNGESPTKLCRTLATALRG